MLIIGMWSNPEVNGQCVTLFGGFVMEKLSNTKAIVSGGSELDVDSAAAGSVYILDISILINTVVHIYSLMTLLLFGQMGLSKYQWLLYLTIMHAS